MPVSVDMELVRMSQEEFGTVAYRVMREVFALHAELGRLFDERVYQHALAARIGDLRREVRIDVCFLNAARLDTLQWINISRHQLTL
jgi:hypothetical protein